MFLYSKILNSHFSFYYKVLPFLRKALESFPVRGYLWLRLQVEAAARQQLGGAAAGVFEERGAAAGQAALLVPQHGSGLLVRPHVSADHPEDPHLGGAEEGRVAGAGPLVKSRGRKPKDVHNVCIR